MNSKDKKTEKEKNKKNKKRRNPFRFFFYDFLKYSCAWSIFLWLRPKRLYESKKAKKPVWGGAVVIANHSGFHDPIILNMLFWYRHLHMLALQLFFESRRSRWFFRNMLCIPVNKENFNIQTFRAAEEVLKEGHMLGIFPEGQINTDEKVSVQSFKSGAVFMALKANVPIVPVYIRPHLKWYERAVMVVGEPIRPEELTSGALTIRAIEETSQKLREKEIKLMEIYNQWQTRKSSK